MSPFEYSLTKSMCGRIQDVVIREDKICLLSGDSGIVWAIPLICPVCNQPWHFVSEDLEGEVKRVRTKIKGFNLVGINYIGQTSIQRIEHVSKSLFEGTSDLYEDFVDEVPSHMGMHGDFPAIAMILEKRRRGRDADDIMLAVHPLSILNSMEIWDWQDKN